jgi:hypothetical protein
VQVYWATDRSLLGRSLVVPVLAAIPMLGLAVAIAPSVPTTFLWLLFVTGVGSAFYVSLVLLLSGLSETEMMVLRSTQERFGIDSAALDWLIQRLPRR